MSVRVITPDDWSHHSGGWADCVAATRAAMHDDTGIPLHMNGAIPNIIESEQPQDAPWTAVLHVSPSCVSRLRPGAGWPVSRTHCVGLFVLSEIGAAAIRSRFPGIPVAVLPYAAKTPATMFDPASLRYRRHPVLCLGHWLRDLPQFAALELPANYQKRLLTGERSDWKPPADIRVTKYVDDAVYNAMLTHSLVFLPLQDAGANTAVVECLLRANPLVVSRHPAVAEYLGVDYPLLYDNVPQAAAWLQDTARLQAAHEYLRQRNVRHLRLPHFVSTLRAAPFLNQTPDTT